MIDEQEVAGASNSVQDAPSLQASRTSGRPLQPSKRLIESRGQEQLRRPITNGRRKRKPHIVVYEDLNTPPPSQLQSEASQWLPQEGTDYTSSQKRRRKATTSVDKQKEQWEVDFDGASSNPSKFQVLLEALGRKDFPQRIRIPERAGKANFSEELDPLNPLWLWSQFMTLEVL
jgi:hypothetical protein